MTSQSGAEVLEVAARPEAVPQVRRWLRGLLLDWGVDDLLDDAELLVTELVGNVVLHAPGPAKVGLALDDRLLRLEVADTSVTVPERRPAQGGVTTGRGLNLVSALAQGWGVHGRDDGQPGKVVWATLGGAGVAAPEPEPDLDVDALLAAFDDELEDVLPRRPALHEVVVGDVPVVLAVAAKEHLDSLLREFALAGGGGGALATEVVGDITRAVARFAEARTQLRRQLIDARERGLERAVLTFTLPAATADAGEDYLRALAEADIFARDRRLLTLESPVAFRVFREWYVEALIAGLRAAAAGRRAAQGESFEARLLRELERLDDRAREAELAAQLQRVTARLAGAQTQQEIAQVAVEEGTLALAADGATLARPGDAHISVLVETGIDLGVRERYGLDPDRPAGPSTVAIRTGEAVFLEAREERDQRYPHLAGVQPQAASVAALPLVVAGQVVGAVRFSFAAPHVFSAAERAYLDGLAAQTAQAVARTEALERLRRAEERSRALARLGDELGTRRTVDGILEAVVAVVLPHLGNGIAVHLLDERGHVWAPLVRHADPEISPAFEALLRRSPVTVGQPFGAGRVLVTGRPEQLPAGLQRAFEEQAGDDEQLLAVVRRGRAYGGLVLPLLARGRTLGALSVTRPTRGPVGEEDAAFLEDVARRTGVALDNVETLAVSQRHELALESAGVGSFDMHVPTGHLLWDQRLYALLDVDPATFDGTLGSFFARVVPEDAERIQAAIERAIDTAGELAVDYRVRRRDGSLRWIEARGRGLAGPDGHAERLVGVCVDVTAQRDASDRALRSIELMGEAFLQVDAGLVVQYANGRAQRLTGLPRAQMVGASLLDVFPDTAGTEFERRHREALRTGEPARFECWSEALGTLLLLRAHPALEGMGVYVSDVGPQRTAVRERDRALERLRLLDDVGSTLSATLDVDEALTALAERMLPDLADLVTVDLRDGDDVRGLREVVITAVDPERAQLVAEADRRLPRRKNPRSAVHRVLAGEPYIVVVVDDAYLARIAVDAEQLELYRRLDMRHVVVAPLTARGRVLGALSLLRCGSDAVPYSQQDVQFAVELGRRAGLILDNAAQYTAQRALAEGLQRSLLPELPEVPGAELGAAYEPSSSHATVGGDWYDAFVLPGGDLGLVVGDVMGHDIAAAAAMGQLRSVLRTCAADGDGPAQVLDRLDRLVTSFAMADLATVLYAHLSRRPDGSADLEWSNAGHPPPLLLAPGEPPRYLEAGSSTMIGVQAGPARTAATAVLPAGSTLLMYTDGLVERRGTDLDVRLEELRTTAAALLAEGVGPDELCRHLLATSRGDGSSDDAAAVALRLR